jgi:hypothetical protein
MPGVNPAWMMKELNQGVPKKSETFFGLHHQLDFATST